MILNFIHNIPHFEEREETCNTNMNIKLILGTRKKVEIDDMDIQ